MAVLTRLTPFAPATLIQSSQVNAEFNQLVNMLSGVSTDKDTLIKFSDAANPVLRVDQLGAGAIQHWLQNSVEKARIQNNGALRINSTQAQDAASIGLSNDSNNLAGAAIAAVLQNTASSQIALRLAMESVSSGGVTAFQITKFDGGAVQQYLSAKSNGEIRTAAGYPSTMANVPTGTTVCLGGQYQQNVSTVGNVGAGQDDLHSYTVAANVLANDGDSLDFIGGGTVLAAGTTKEVGFSFAGTLVFLSGAFDPAADIGWSMHVTATRISSSAVIVTSQFMNSANVNTSGNAVQVGGLSFTGTLIGKWTGQDTDGVNNRVTQTMSVLRKFAKGS